MCIIISCGIVCNENVLPSDRNENKRLLRTQRSELEASRKTHDVARIHNFLQRLQPCDILSIHLLQWCGEYRIVRVDRSCSKALLPFALSDTLNACSTASDSIVEFVVEKR